MICPYKPSLTCAGTPELADEGRCIGCPAGRASGRSTRSLKLHELPLNDYFVILREQLRGQLAEAEKVSKIRPKVKGASKDLVKGKSKHFFEASGSESSKHFGVKSGVKGVYFAGEAP